VFRAAGCVYDQRAVVRPATNHRSGDRLSKSDRQSGIQYAAKLGCIYYTATAKNLFMRVRINPEMPDASGEPEHVSAGRVADDFCIDEDAGVAYVTTPRCPHHDNAV
jgi:hypothetical protein